MSHRANSHGSGSSTSSRETPPAMPPDSPGSSVSSRLQEEYDELLKYAVVVPSFNPQDNGHSRPYSGAAGRGAINADNDIITITGQPNCSTFARDTERARQEDLEGETEMEQITPRRTADRPGSTSHLPEFSPTYIFSSAPHSKSSFTEHLRTGTTDRVGGSTNPFIKKVFPKMEGKERRDGEKERRDAGKEDISARDKAEEDKMQEEVASVFKATLDHDIGRLDTLLEQWCLDLRRSVLAEFGQAKVILEQKTKVDLNKEMARHASEKAELIQELDSIKEYLHNFEQSMHRKDAVISNLTKAMFRMRDKIELMRNFCTWRIQHIDAKRESFAALMAEKHYRRTLNRKVLSSWFSTIHSKWRSRVEKACQVKAQEVCLQVTTDYEAKIASLNEALEASREEVRHLHVEREKYEEAMKKAFMRGVCALNMEAMSMFHGDEGTECQPNPRIAGDDGDSGEDYFSDILNSQAQDKGQPSSKSMPHDAVRSSLPAEPLPARVVTSQGSRSMPVTLPRTSSAKAATITSHKPRAAVKIAERSSCPGGNRSLSPPLRPQIASVVVERHNPVTKQTIGHATAARFPRTSLESEKFRRLAGQGNITKNPPIQTVRVVD